MKYFIALLLVIAVVLCIALLMPSSKKIGTHNDPTIPNNNQAKDNNHTTNNTGTEHKLSQEQIYSLVKSVRNNIPEENNNLPKSMKDINITPELQKYFDDRPYVYEKFDYRLRLFDTLNMCLGDNSPEKGKITVFMLFNVDFEEKVSIGIDGNMDTHPDAADAAFKIAFTDLKRDEIDLVLSCLKESHIGLTMDMTRKLTIEPEKQTPVWVHPVSISFPLKNDKLYSTLENRSKPSQ